MIAVSFTVKAAYILVLTEPQSYIVSDMGIYDRHAIQTLKGERMWEPTHWSPAYTLFLAAVYYFLKLVGLFEHRLLLMPVLNCLMSSVSVFFVYQTAKRLSNADSALLTAAIYAFFYPITYVNIFLLSENLQMPLLTGFLYLVICKLDKKMSGHILAGLLLGTAVVVKPLLLLYMPVYVIWYAYHTRSYRQLTVFAGAFLLVLFLQAAYNYNLTGGKVLSISSSSGGSAFALSWCDLKTIRYRTPGGSWGWITPPAHLGYEADKVAVTNVGFSNQSYYYRMGLNCIEKNPPMLVWNLKQIWRLIDSRMFPVFNTVTGYKWLLYISKLFTYLVLLPFSLASYNLLKKDDRKYFHLLAALIASFFASVYLQAVGGERYFVPYQVAFIILGGIGLTAQLRQITHDQKGSRHPTVRPKKAHRPHAAKKPRKRR